MSGVVASVIEDTKGFLAGAGNFTRRTASQVALAALVALTAATLGPVDAHAQTVLPTNAAATQGTGPSAEVCGAAATVLNGYVRGNVSTFSVADRQQLGILNSWIAGGCRGTVTIGRTIHSIGAATFLQATLGRQYNFDNSIRFAGLDNGRRFAGDASYEVKYG